MNERLPGHWTALHALFGQGSTWQDRALTFESCQVNHRLMVILNSEDTCLDRAIRLYKQTSAMHLMLL